MSASGSGQSGAPRIILVNGWHDDNRGDGAIVEATIGLIRECLPNARMSLVSMFSETQSDYVGAHRHLLARYPGLEVVPAPFRGYGSGNLPERLVSALTSTLRASRSFLGLMSPFTWSPAERLIASVDLVISKGGHYLHGGRPNHPIDLQNLYRLFFPLMVAARHGVPFTLFGHSLGPFPDVVSRKMTSAVLNRAAWIGIREELSLAAARQAGVSAERLHLVPDPAFAILPERTPRVQRLLDSRGLHPGQFLAITVRHAVSGGRVDASRRTEEFAARMETFIRRALQGGLAPRVALVPQVHGPFALEDDRLLSRRLAHRLRDCAVTLVEEDLTPAELSSVYGDARLVLGTRFHSVILALAAGTPAFAISYFGPKSFGIMRMLGLERLCVSMEELEPARMCDAIASEDLGRLRELVRVRVAGFRAQLRAAMPRLLAPVMVQG